MTIPSYGDVAYLDLPGNRIDWSEGDRSDDKIRLDGSNFRNTILMATLAISASCFLSFLVIALSACCVCCNRRHGSKYLPWPTVWVPVFCMMDSFGLDIVNRIFHEFQEIVPPAYIAIDIPMGSLSSLADGLLMVYFLFNSPVDMKSHGRVWKLLMYFAVWAYLLLSVGGRGMQIWNLMVQINPNFGNSARAAGGKSRNGSSLSLQIYKDLGSGATSMLVLFAIGFALFSGSFIRHLSRTNTACKRLAWTVGVLASTFLARNTAIFIFTLIYSQFSQRASLDILLTYLAFYGILSVVIYGCIVVIAAVQQKEKSPIDEHGYVSVQQPVGEGGSWRQKPSQVDERMEEHANMHATYPYNHDNGYLQRW